MSRMALAPGRAREYETIFILRPTVDKEAVDVITQRTAEAVKAQQGHLTELELWGRRRLAYPISRHHRGVYVYMKYLGRGGVVSELERQLRLADSVIRYQTILLRNNVAFDGVALPDAKVDMEAELPPEPDEPEMSRERELGLDAPFADRDRRGRRDDRFRDDRGPSRDDSEAAPDGEAAGQAAGDAGAADAAAGGADGPSSTDKDKGAAPAPDGDAATESAAADEAKDTGEEG